VRQAEKTGEAIWHDIECGAYTADIPLWKELASDACHVLELGCGTGRVSLVLAEAGCEVTALDIEHELLEELRSRAGHIGVQLTAVAGDAGSFELDTRFDLVIAPMQVIQLLQAHEREGMLKCIARHLRPGAQAALALLDPEDEWEATGDSAPPPDGLELNGWKYSSQPVAVRRTSDDRAIELDRVRRVVAPGGEAEHSFSRTRLELLSPAQLEREATRAGLLPDGRRQVPATEDHVGTTVAVLRAAAGDA
jgi:SAM-dependent methyltransferase